MAKDPAHIRNIGILAHIDAGKTTLTERILFYSGSVHKAGDVDSGNTITDYLTQERERGITITSAAVTYRWKGHTVNLIDTPGHVDFTIEVERSLKVLDGAVAMFDGVAGVQPQSETVWRQAEKFKVPRLAFINKMDRAGADFEHAVATIDERLNGHCVPIQIPVGAAEDFTGIIDLVRMEYFVNDESDFGVDYRWEPIPASERTRAEQARSRMIEALADIDDDIAVKFLEGNDVNVAQIKAALRRACIERKFTLVMCGSAFKYRGVQPVMDAVIDYLPSPLDMPPVVGIDGKTIRRATIGDPFCALAFKLINDSYGQMTFIRVYSGRLSAGSFVYNSNTKQKERVARLVHVQADKRQNVDEISVGDIAAIIGLRNTLTGHTLCDESK